MRVLLLPLPVTAASRSPRSLVLLQEILGLLTVAMVTSLSSPIVEPSSILLLQFLHCLHSDPVLIELDCRRRDG